jgi:competence protein ComEC
LARHASVDPDWRVGIAVSAALIAAALARFRWWRIATVAAFAALLALLFWYSFPPEIHSGQLELTAVDVGQGDGLLVVFPDRKRLLVDGGGIPAFGGRAPAQLDTGENEMLRSDVLKVAHHGSLTSWTRAFSRCRATHVAVISASFENS